MGDSNSSSENGEGGGGLGVRAPTMTGFQLQNKTEQKFGSRLAAAPAASAKKPAVSFAATAAPKKAVAAATAAVADANFNVFGPTPAAAPKKSSAAAAAAAEPSIFNLFGPTPAAAAAPTASDFNFFGPSVVAEPKAPVAPPIPTGVPISAADNYNIFGPTPAAPAAPAAAADNYNIFGPATVPAAPVAAADNFNFFGPSVAAEPKAPVAPPIPTGVPISAAPADAKKSSRAKIPAAATAAAAPDAPTIPTDVPISATAAANFDPFGAAAVPTLEVSELAAGPVPYTALAAKAGPAIVKKVAVMKPIPLPADAPLLAKADFNEEMKKRFKGPEPVQAKPAEIKAIVDAKKGLQTVYPYRPITSRSFSSFITQTFSQYSPYLERVLRDGAAAAAEPKEVDQEACKKRDPNKVETFYYQSFVRDYLSYGSPYRGLLVYHGLGSGKTCTSVAAAEALYWGGQKKIYVLTPATLSNNYRKDLGKCGYYPLRSNNFWAFLALDKGRDSLGDPNYAYITQGLGLPPELVIAQGGGWIPNPDRPSNWDGLSPDVKDAIKRQQLAHLNHRFQFIHYNGVSPLELSTRAAEGVAEGKSMFDDAVVVIDEIHNLVRTINGTEIGSIPMSKFIKTVEQREPTWSALMTQKTPGYKYPRGYSLYRLLQNAVGAKIIALSATPMINYAQEFAILLNLIGGEQRMAEISLKSMSRDPKVLVDLEAWVQKRPDIDFYKVEEGGDGKAVLNVTPVPFGFVKVVTDTYETRGFVRMPPIKVGSVKNSRERNMEKWAASLVGELEAANILKGVSVEATAAATAATEPIGTRNPFKIHTLPMLPDDPEVFLPNFVDRTSLKILHTNVLKARATGLISYYRGGSEELMPRTGKNELVLVPMSDYQFKVYSAARLEELKETPEEEPDEDAGSAKRKGMTAAEADLYAQATKSPSTGFLCFSRAACNWVFPEDVPRPIVDPKKQEKLLGIEKDRVLSVDAAVDPKAGAAAAGGKKRPTIPKAASASAAAAAGASVAAAAAATEVPEVIALPDEEGEAPPEPVDPDVAAQISSLMSGLEARGDIYLNVSLPEFSAKYATMLDNIRKSPGPALVYSQFITLEGLGIFAAAMRASPEKYMQLDLVKEEGEWAIPAELMTPEALERPRYILYTGAQDPEKRRLSLQLYNADLAVLPRRLREQCEIMLAGAPDNRDGRVCRVFMISASGAEGISLFNTRQVNIMEPYWNNVRLQQVVGRAIRLCSHMNQPWEDRVVDVYTYMSVFTARQKAEGSKKIMKADKSMSTDQLIYDIATKKQKLADGLYEIAQTAATDCEIHYHEHGAVTQCYKFAEGGRPGFAFHPDWRKDIKEGDVKSVASRAPTAAPAYATAAAAGATAAFAEEGEGEGAEEEGDE